MRRLLVLALFLAGCGGEETARPTEEEAVAAFRAGDMEATFKKLEELVEAESIPADPVSLMGGYAGFVNLPEGDDPMVKELRLALEHLESGNYQEANPHLLSVITKSADPSQASLLLGLSYLARGQDRSAQGALSKAGRTWAAHLARAVGHDRVGEIDWSNGQLDVAAHLGQDKPVVRYYLARRALKMGDPDLARKLLTE